MVFQKVIRLCFIPEFPILVIHGFKYIKYVIFHKTRSVSLNVLEEKVAWTSKTLMRGNDWAPYGKVLG